MRRATPHGSFEFGGASDTGRKGKVWWRRHDEYETS